MSRTARNMIRLALMAALAAGALAAAAGAAPHVAAPPAVAAGELDELLSTLEGGWYGEDNDTPMGPMAFALLFERREDGSLAARTSLNRETYVELHFARDAAGRWTLREEAGMEGLGVHSYTLLPLGRVGDNHRWVYAGDPGFLWLDVGVDGDSMHLDVRLRGERHVRFDLDRLPADEVAELREQLARQASQSPEEGYSIHDIVAAQKAAAEKALETAAAAGAADGDDPIAAARAAVAKRPGDGRARLELARKLGAAIQQDPANGPRYGYEMLASLEKAIELDPALAEAYHWLAGYYLEAPPIAGGSLERAEQTAHELARIDPDGAEELLQRIAARRDGK